MTQCDCIRQMLSSDNPMPHVPGCPASGHVHSAPHDGSGDWTAPDGSVHCDDECECGVLLCPDTGTEVTYRSGDSEYDLPSYWHIDGSTCFLHQTAVPCLWFALCDHPAIGTVSHPIIGEVPTCQRCADKLGLTFS